MRRLIAHRRAAFVGGVLAVALLGGALAAAQEIAAAGDTAPHAELSLSELTSVRFIPAEPEIRRLELEFSAGGGDAPFDIAVAQRATLGANADGELALQGGGSEVRVGRGLVQRGDNRRGEAASVYMFVASDNEALTWQPGGSQGAALALEERVEVGDVSAGVTYERGGVQASLAYVEREASAQIGRESYSQDESFTGLTVTMRR
ncbi:MAG: hypothetical protein ABL864_04815 [Terricaulis sp.]